MFGVFGIGTLTRPGVSSLVFGHLLAMTVCDEASVNRPGNDGLA